MRAECLLWICVGILGTLMLDAACGQTTLQVVWMIPARSHSYTNYVNNASSSVAALALGLEEIKIQNILPGHVLNITYLDTDCDSKQSLGGLVELLFQQHVDVVLGPPCSEVVIPVGELMSYRKTPVMNWVSMGQTIAYKTDLTTYIRTMSPISSLGGIMMMFYYYTGWRRFVIISSEGDDHRAGAETINFNIKYHESNGFYVAHHYEEIRTNPSVTDIDAMLSNIIHEARIIILLMPRRELRTFMLRAHFLGMTGGDYQFLFTDTQLADDEDVSIINSNQLWYAGDQYDQQAKQAFENVLYFVLGHNTEPVSSWRDKAMQAYSNIFSGRSDMPLPSEPDEYAAYVHDTIVYYAMLLNKTLSKNYTGSGDDLFTWASSVHFKGLSGDVVINQLGDRQPAFYVYDMNSTGSFHQVASLQYAINQTTDSIRVKSTFTKIIWGDGKTTDDPYIPPDSPVCGFFHEFCADTADTSKHLDDWGTVIEEWSEVDQQINDIDVVNDVDYVNDDDYLNYV